jgi:hypothetical protein
VPAGISDRLTISKYGPATPVNFKASRMSGTLNLLDAIDFFELGILDDDAGTEILVDSDKRNA